MTDRVAARVIACDILARWEREARVNGQGLKTVVELDAVRLLKPGGLELPDDATAGDRVIAERDAWARVDEGRARADAWRLVSRVLRRILAVLGGAPIYDREAPPETARQARVGMFVESRGEESEWFASSRVPNREPGDLNKVWVVAHADDVEKTLGWPPFVDTCSGCGLAASKGQRTCALGDACEGLVSLPHAHVPGCDGKRRADVVCPACYEEPPNAS